MNDLISKLSEIRSEYNCFDEDEEPYYRALSEAIKILSQRTDDDTINRQAAIDGFYEMASDMDHLCTVSDYVSFLESLPSVQPESYQEKLKEIADALSEKFAYMHTCLNERDIILGYLGVKHSNEIHCNTDCTNTKCESYHFNKKLPFAQQETCKDDKGCSSCMYSGRPTYKSPCSECRDNSQWERKVSR